ncbi:MAG: type I restriction endonuclease [Oscillospiraceae bacterium]
MDFIDQVKQFSKRALSMRESLQTEEATKTAIIMPFFSMLGYDVFNPEEFSPEFTADVGIKQGEKVDYAIMQNGEPIILIEAKWIGGPLEKHDSQLFRYFGTCTAKFGILTNGLIYKFYTDLDAPNKMDLKPFLVIDISDVKESQISELKKFQKSNFNLEEIINTASELRYTNDFRKKLMDELSNPSDDFVRFFLADTYDGVKTQNVIDKFRPILKKALNNYINELMSDKITTALKAEDEVARADADTSENPETAEDSRIETTQSEIEAYAIVRGLLMDVVPPEDVFYRDTESYFSILYKDNNRKWICRFRIKDDKVLLSYPDENKKEIRHEMASLYDVEEHKDSLIQVVNRYISQ